MINHIENNIDAIIDKIWTSNIKEETPTVYAILDCARDRRIEPLINNSKNEHICLYSGSLSHELKRSAPHLVKLNKSDNLTKSIINLGWGNSWGIFALTYIFAPIAEVLDEVPFNLIFNQFLPETLF